MIQEVVCGEMNASRTRKNIRNAKNFICREKTHKIFEKRAQKTKNF